MVRLGVRISTGRRRGDNVDRTRGEIATDGSGAQSGVIDQDVDTESARPAVDIVCEGGDGLDVRLVQKNRCGRREGGMELERSRAAGQVGEKNAVACLCEGADDCGADARGPARDHDVQRASGAGGRRGVLRIDAIWRLRTL